MLRTIGLCLLFILLVLQTNCSDNFVEKETISSYLEGSWKVKEIHYIYPDTTYIASEKDEGRFIFTVNQYALIYNPTMRTRPPFSNLSSPTDPETIGAFRNIVFNTGSYVLKDSIIATMADIAKVPGFEGGAQFYRTQFQSIDKLHLTMFDETYPNGEKPAWYQKLEVKFVLTKE